VKEQNADCLISMSYNIIKKMGNITH